MAWKRIWSFLILRILLFVEESNTTVKAFVFKIPQLQLKASVAPKTDVMAGDTVVYSFEVFHSNKSFANALDVELQIISPVFLVVGSHTLQNDSLKPDNITKGSQEVIFKFKNISMKSHVMVTMDILVDPYYMFGTRDEMFASSVVNLWYYGQLDACDRPLNRWNARSMSRNILFTFIADKVCERSLQALYESQFLASSFDKSNFDSLGNSPHRAMFEQEDVWSPASFMNEDVNQYLHIEFDQLMRITKMATKGNGEMDLPSFVTNYVVYYSKNGLRWSKAKASYKSEEFPGNTDSTTVKVNNMKIPIEVKFLRIIPKTWKNKIALKVKLFGCVVYRVPAGHQPLGISSGFIKNNQITVESGNSFDYPPYNARLNLDRSKGGWCITSLTQTLVVDLGTSHVITKLAVQSRFQTTGNLIDEFYLAYKNDGGTKTYVMENNEMKKFLGNPLEDITIRHRLLKAITAEKVYIEPKEQSTGCLRIELYGYKKDEVPNADYCKIIDFEDGTLMNWSTTGSAFDNQPTFYDNLYARTGHVANPEGAWWIGTRENRKRPSEVPGKSQGNQPIGTLTSPGFLIAFSKLFFLFAGTPDPEKARIELLVNDVVVRVASAKTGNESMIQMVWDVRDLVSSEAKIRVVDNAADGFVSFDGLKGNCDLEEDQFPVFEKSFLLSPSDNILYVCQLSHSSDPDGAVCRFTSDNGLSWKDLSPHLSGLLGIHKISGKLYGVSRNGDDCLESKDWTGKFWKIINSSVWKSIRDDASMMSVVEIPHIPITGLRTDKPSSVFTLKADTGDEYTASSLGVYHKASGGSWEMIAKWFCKEYPSVCISQPCNNGGTCNELGKDDYNCSCPKGFTGKICDNDVDDCQVDSCDNGGKCIDGFNNFFCLCNSFFTGPRCERNINDCATSPCSEGALCIDGLGNFTCQCPSGFVGELCELEIDECASIPCQHRGLCVDELNSYKCHCRRGYSGTNCEHVHSSAFEVLSSRSIQYGAHRYVVVKARLPSDGRSLYQTWCHDYQMLCHSLNKTRPTGCGRSFNHIIENHECLTKYDAVMDHNDTLGCPPNIQVSSIAKMAGYSASTSSNSFAFSQCDDSHCTAVLSQSECHKALSCIKQSVANTEVYTICSYSDSNFVVEDKRSTSFKGINYLALYIKPITSTARHENWCRDYQRLCQSYGKRPIGCGRTSNQQSSQCQKDYLSINVANSELDCENISQTVGQNAGLPSTSDGFAFHLCSETGCQKKLPNCSSRVRCFNDSNMTYHTVCTEPRTGFTVLDERQTTFNNVSLLLIKARLPRDRKSSQDDWCRDYYTLCHSYGLRPTGCSGITRDYGYTNCRDKYGSVGHFLDCLPGVKVAELAQKVGFSAATEHNSFAFNKCSKCSSILSTTDCADKGLGCVKPSKNDDVYTVCVDPTTLLDILETKTTTYNNTAYLVIKARLPGNKKFKIRNVSTEYKQLCSQYGRRSIQCNNTLSYQSSSSTAVHSSPSTVRPSSPAVTSSSLAVPSSSPTVISSTSAVNSSSPALLSSSPAVLSSSPAVPSSSPVVISSTSAVNSSCPAVLSSSPVVNSSSPAVNSSSSSVPPSPSTVLPDSCSVQDHQEICNGDQPRGDILKTIAQKAGFNDATNTNSLIFSSHECENFNQSDDVIYTFCQGPDSNFDVTSTKIAKHHGQTYLVIKACLPSHRASRYEDWCEDYKRMCYSYGQRPTGCGGKTTTSLSSYTACRDSYDSYIPDDNNLGCPSNYMITLLANQSGFSMASLNNTFSFSFCNDTCAKNISEKNILLSSADLNRPVYTVCSSSNTSFTVTSTRDISYQGSSYKVIKATIPSDMTAKLETWCGDYHEVCKSHGMRPVVTSKDSDLSCERNYNGLTLKRNELYAPEMLQYLLQMAGYLNSSVGNIFAFRKSCQNTCFSQLEDFKSIKEPALHVDSGIVASLNHVTYAVCVSSDSSFKVVDSRSYVHGNRAYLVLKTRIPSDGISKFHNWCLDYRRLCTGYEMRPVTFMEIESSYINVQTSCVEAFMSVVIPRNLSLHLLAREHVASIAKLAGYTEASRENSFAFGECNSTSCSPMLTSECSGVLDCLTNLHHEAYTLCTDSDSNFVVEQTRYIKHKTVPYLLIQSNIPEHGLSRHDNWCSDYQHLCNSFGMQPTGCGASWNNSGNSRCVVDYQSFASPVDNIGCGDEALTILREMSEKSSWKNGTVFVFKDCEFCFKTVEVSCDNAIYCLRRSKSVVTICASLESHFKVLEVKRYEYSGQRLTIAKTRVTSNGSSLAKNWCHDYKKMCLSLGKRPFSCAGFPGDVGQYNNREQYNTFLFNSGICPSNAILHSLAIQAGFSLASQQNVLGFINCTSCTKQLLRHVMCSEVVDVIGELVNPITNPKNCCKCSNETIASNNTLVTILRTNSSFSSSWKGCVSLNVNQSGKLEPMDECYVARDCLNNTILALNPCELLSKCLNGSCFDCCACNYTSRNVCHSNVLMKPCPHDSKCSHYIPQPNEDVYTFCSDYSDSNFEVQDARDIEYAGLPYTVLRVRVPPQGYSRSSSWCEDYKMLCASVGKRPVGCGRDANVFKRSRECHVKYDAIMVEGMLCPASEELANIALHAGFPATINQSVGLWRCDQCNRNFTDTWNTTNTTLDVYAVCSGSHSNFDVMETRTTDFYGAAVTVIMASVPHHGLSLHKDWCLDYSQLCQSYGQRPVGCAASKDNINEHAQCRHRYGALMFSDGSIDCLENSNAHSVAQTAGFKQATRNNTIMFNSCLSHHCTKSLLYGEATEHAFGKFKFNSTDHVVFTVCASSDSAFGVVAKKPLTVEQQDYLVIRAKIPAEGKSKYENWCRDYQRLCEGYGMLPLSCESSSQNPRLCRYNYEPFNMATNSTPCSTASGVALIAQKAGFDNVFSSNSFAFDVCDATSCPDKIPSLRCFNVTNYYSVFTTITKEAIITKAEFVTNTSRTEYCLILPNPNPPFTVQGIELKASLQNFTCDVMFNTASPGVNISFFNVTVNQTFENSMPNVTRLCEYIGHSALARMSREVNTLCIPVGVGTNFAVESTRMILSSGREYLIIKSRLLSPTSKSQSWCVDYKKLCQSFDTSPLACPNAYILNTDYFKCVESYEAIMMSDVEYGCPSNDFISELAQIAGYKDSGPANSFALLNCEKCQSILPLSGCGESLHCLSEQAVDKYVYTACVITNSDSNFHVVEKRTTTYNGEQFTVIRSRIPTDGKSLHDTWCLDYQRLCESLNLRPICKNGISAEKASLCQRKYNAMQYNGPRSVYKLCQDVFGSGPGATETNSFSFSSCDSCSRTLTSSCNKGLKCLKTGVPLNEVYTVCGDTKAKTSFKPIATKDIQYGNFRFRVVQAKLTSHISVNSDWGKDYENLCRSYDEVPTGCGQPGAEKDPGVYFCGEKYSSYLLPGGELLCDPNTVISKLARNVGFRKATPDNSFGFSSCNSSSLSTLSSSCSTYLPCLRWQDSDPIVYTVCLKTNVVSNFKVLSTKTVKYLQSSYLVVHALLPSNGISLHENWCSDYQKLCDSFGMRPTGCGGSSIHQSNYSMCGSTYGSYMPADNSLRCGDSKIASRIVNKAGYRNSIPRNTFVFYNCEECSSTLSKTKCDDALWCINDGVWKNEVFTLCVDPPTNFNVVKTTSVQYNGIEYFVVEAKLPSDGRSKSDNWCRDYEMLCKKYDRRPVSCHKTIDNRKCVKEYHSIVTSTLSCDTASSQASIIAVSAGFNQATTKNSFIMNECDPRICSKELPVSDRTEGLSSIDPNLVDNVYAICTEEKSVFKVVDSKKVSVSGAVYSIVSAVLSKGTYNTWCQDYSNLCYSVGQSPVVLFSDVVNEDISTCRDKFDGVLLPREMDEFVKDGVYHVAAKAGFIGASYGNTFLFKSCSQEACSLTPHAFNCSHSLYCLNGGPEELERTVYGVCVENTLITNYYVLDTGTVNTNNTKYLALKVRLPQHRQSKYESWCRDYELLCQSYNMRPLSTVPSAACQLEYHSIFHNNYDHLAYLNVVHKAGFPNASSENFYILQQCYTKDCGRNFRLPQCIMGACTSGANQNREIYTLCSSLEENFAANFEVQGVRNVWFDADFLVAQVRMPSHGSSKSENWCKDYQRFCESYSRRPYTSIGLSKKETFDYGACYWKYNATSYRLPSSSSAIVQRAGFNPSSGSCVSSLYQCSKCGKNLEDLESCPFENCQAAIETCLDYYIICT